MTKKQAQALVNLQLASDVLSITVRRFGSGDEWFVRILTRDREHSTDDFVFALGLMHDAIKARTPR